MHSQCILFADDTTVYISGINEPVLRQLIEYDLASLTDWFHANKLPLHGGQSPRCAMGHTPLGFSS